MPKQSLPRVVIALGLLSFCNDLASEMVRPALAWCHVAPRLRRYRVILGLFTLALRRKPLSCCAVINCG